MWKEDVCVKIYELRDPRDPECKPRYVGITIGTLQKRLISHIAASKEEKNYKANWIKSLLKIGIRPSIHLIEEVYTREKASKAEIYWIKEFREQGYELTNATEGGDSVGFKHSSDSIEKMRNKVVTEETRRKQSLARKGIKYSEETLAKLRICHAGEKGSNYNHVVNRESFLEDYNNGLTCTQIAKKNGVSYSLVNRHLKKFISKFRTNHKTKPRLILQYDLDGNFIREWYCIKDIITFFKCGPCSISITHIRNTRRTMFKYMWREGEINYPLKISPFVRRTKYTKEI